VISNYRKNLISRASVEKERLSLTPGHFFKKIEESMQNCSDENTNLKETK